VIVVISDLLNMFTQDHDHNINCNEAIFLIREIITSIKKTLDKALVVASFQKQQQHKSYSIVYDKILLPRFDKRIEITKSSNSINDSSNINLLDVKIYNKSKNFNRSLVLEERDLLIIPDPK
jgi:hypothetical protein